MPRVSTFTTLINNESERLRDAYNAAALSSNRAANLRPGSKSDHNSKDRVLRRYQAVVTVAHRLENCSPEIIDAQSFPPDQQDDFSMLFDQISRFFVVLVENASPRSLKDEIIGFRILQENRNAFLYFIPVKYKELRRPAPHRGLIEQKLAVLLLSLVRDYNIQVEVVKEKPYLGPVELEQLIDLDLQTTECIEAAEGHELAWTIARATALRPHSLSPVRESIREDFIETQHIVFGDFDVRRDELSGQFTMKLKVRNVKGNGHIDEDTACIVQKTLFFKIKSPQKVHNIALSPVFRFLVLCIRRGALEHYQTIDQLLDDPLERHHILIKDEFKDRPVLLASKHRKEISTNTPLTAANLTYYLQLRGLKCGFQTVISFYGIRRRTATDWARLLGKDEARALMGHKPGSKVLEEYYLNTPQYHDLSAIAGNEDISARLREIELEMCEIGLNALDPEVVTVKITSQIPIMLLTLITDDPDFPHHGTASEKENRKRILRRKAFDVLLQEAIVAQQETLTNADMAARKQKILEHKSIFNQLMLGITRTDEEINDGRPRRVPVESIEPRHTAITFALPDAAALETIPPSPFAQRLDALPYKEATRSAMRIMFQNMMVRKLDEYSGRCAFCVTQPAVSEVARTDIWSSGLALQRHVLRAHNEQDDPEPLLFWRYQNAYQAMQNSLVEERQESTIEDIDDILADEQVIPRQRAVPTQQVGRVNIAGLPYSVQIRQQDNFSEATYGDIFTNPIMINDDERPARQREEPITIVDSDDEEKKFVPSTSDSQEISIVDPEVITILDSDEENRPSQPTSRSRPVLGPRSNLSSRPTSRPRPTKRQKISRSEIRRITSAFAYDWHRDRRHRRANEPSPARIEPLVSDSSDDDIDVYGDEASY